MNVSGLYYTVCTLLFIHLTLHLHVKILVMLLLQRNRGGRCVVQTVKSNFGVSLTLMVITKGRIRFRACGLQPEHVGLTIKLFSYWPLQSCFWHVLSCDLIKNRILSTVTTVSARNMQPVRTGTFFFFFVLFQLCFLMKGSAGGSAESHRGSYWCNDYKRCGTLCFDLLATLQCNCTHIWKVHIGHSPLSISLQLNGWLCLAVKKWAILPALASCLIVPNLYFIKMMTHCTPSPLLTPVLLISNSLDLVENNKLSRHGWHTF